MHKILFSAILAALSVSAANKCFSTPTYDDLEARLYIVHASITPPQKGKFLARQQPINYKISGQSVQDRYMRCKDEIGGFRPTVSVAIGGLVPPIAQNGQPTLNHETSPFAYVAPLSSVSSRLLNVTAQDTSVIGDLAIDPSKGILIASVDVKLPEGLPEDLKVVRWGEDTSYTTLRGAVSGIIIQEKGGVILEDVSPGTGPAYYETETGEKVDINTSAFFSQLTKKHPHTVFGVQSQHPFAWTFETANVSALQPLNTGTIEIPHAPQVQPIFKFATANAILTMRHAGVPVDALASLEARTRSFWGFAGLGDLDEALAKLQTEAEEYKPSKFAMIPGSKETYEREFASFALESMGKVRQIIGHAIYSGDFGKLGNYLQSLSKEQFAHLLTFYQPDDHFSRNWLHTSWLGAKLAVCMERPQFESYVPLYAKQLSKSIVKFPYPTMETDPSKTLFVSITQYINFTALHNVASTLKAAGKTEVLDSLPENVKIFYMLGK